MAPNTDETVWGAGASVFLAASQVKCQTELGTDWGVPEFYDNLLEDPVNLKAIYEKIYPIAAALIEIDPSTGTLSKTTVSFLLTFRAAVLRYLRPLAENWRAIPAERRFSFIEWLEDSNPSQPPVVLLQRSGKYPALSAAWIGAIVDTIAGHVNDEAFPNSQERRIFLALEELATLRKLRNLSTLLDTGRNKGIGVMASVQEIEELQNYGELEASTILKRFRTKIICQQVLDGDTDEFSKSYVGIRALLMLAAPTQRSCAEVKEIASAHLVSVQAKLADLAKLEHILAATVARCIGDNSPDCPVLDILDRPQAHNS